MFSYTSESDSYSSDFSAVKVRTDINQDMEVAILAIEQIHIGSFVLQIILIIFTVII